MTVLIALVFISISAICQVKKPSGKVKVPAAAISDTSVKTITLRYVQKIDTVKVRLVCYGEENVVIWLNGYQIKTFGIFGPGEAKEIAPTYFLNDKLIAIRPEDVLSVTPIAWK